ncbi:hypothetical protein Tco_0209747 [Tanacetum coccineum]
MVQGERTLGAAKALMNAKVDEPKVGDISLVRDFVDVFPEDLLGLPPQRQVKFRIDLVHGATSVAKSPYRLAPLECKKYLNKFESCKDKGFHTDLSNVKDKILTTPSETSKVENAPAEMLRDLDQQMEKRADDGKENVVTDALSRKERVKPRRVQAMAMTIQYGVRGMILTAQSEAFKSPVLWADIGESSLTGLELVQEMTDKVVMVKEKPKAMNPDNVDKNDPNGVQLQDEDIMYDIALSVEMKQSSSSLSSSYESSYISSPLHDDDDDDLSETPKTPETHSVKSDDEGTK